MIKNRLFSVFTLLLCLCLLLTACSSDKTDDSIIIASKQFTENILLSEMYAQIIENKTDLKVERRLNFGTTLVCLNAIENGEIDFYVDYTGTIYKELLSHEFDENNIESGLFETIKNEMSELKQLTVLNPIGPNNGFAVVMTKIKAEAFGINNISDLTSAAPKLVFGANDIFYTRFNDGYDTMIQKYDLQFKSTVKMDNNLLCAAASEDQVDVIVAYNTDSGLYEYDMVILEDDKKMFTDYYAVPIVRNDTLNKYPELNDILNLLTNSIRNERMQELNYLVDKESKNPEEVARSFLTELGLI